MLIIWGIYYGLEKNLSNQNSSLNSKHFNCKLVESRYLGIYFILRGNRENLIKKYMDFHRKVYRAETVHSGIPAVIESSSKRKGGQVQANLKWDFDWKSHVFPFSNKKYEFIFCPIFPHKFRGRWLIPPVASDVYRGCQYYSYFQYGSLYRDKKQKERTEWCLNDRGGFYIHN